MKKYVKLIAPVYWDSDNLLCESIYRKGVGYCIEIQPVRLESGMVLIELCREYYNICDKGQFLTEAATRRSAKKQAETDTRLETCLADFVNEYLKRISRPDLHMMEE